MRTVTAQVAIVADSLDEHIFTLNELTYFIDPADTLSIKTASSPSFADKFLRHDSYQKYGLPNRCCVLDSHAGAIPRTV
jgi:hypothetical protein